MEKDQEKYGTGKKSDFFKFEKTGVYKLRILTKPVAIATHFFGAGVPASVCYEEGMGCPFHGGDGPATKYLAYAINRADSKLVIVEMPKSVMWQVSDYSEDEDYAFTDYPMPYDIKITFDKEALPKDMYKVMPSPNKQPITEAEQAELTAKLAKLKIEALVEKRMNDALEKHKADGTYAREMERRQKLQDDLNAELAANGKKEPAIVYPEESINPDDIPF